MGALHDGKTGYSFIFQPYLFPSRMGIWFNGFSPVILFFYNLQQGYDQFVPGWYESGKNTKECFKNALTEIGFKNIDIKTHQRCYPFDFGTMIGN